MWFETGIGRTARAFWADERGTAGVEFLVSSPLLFGVLIFTAEYGQALRVRTVLDGAVSDAARLLSLAPAGVTQDASGKNIPAIYRPFIEDAQNMIEQRTGRQVQAFGESQPGFKLEVSLVDSDTFRNDFYVVRVTATVLVEMPMLSFLDLADDAPNNRIGDPNADSFDTKIAMTATAAARYVGAVPIGNQACPIAQRVNNACPTG